MKRLAIVDDNTDLIEMYCDFLEEYEKDHKLDISTFTRPEHAIEAFKTTPPDLLILDFMMPGMNGIDFLITCRELDITISKIFLVTGKAYEVKASGEKFLSDILVIPKPFDIEALIEKIAECLDLH